MEPAKSQGQMPSLERIFNLLNAYQQSAALKAAIEFDLFSAIGEGQDTAPALDSRCRASERGMRILCDYLTVSGLLEKEGGRYRLAPEAAVFLDRRSPAYIGGAVGFLHSPHLSDGFKDVAGAVRKGGTAASAEGTIAPEHPVWVDFARSMAPLMTPSAGMLADLVGAERMGECKVLDVAAGHGVFGITIARRNPRAQIYAVDWPNVLQVATENAQQAGVADRHHRIPGSAFEVDFGKDYDLVLFTNFFHHFDRPTCEGLMRKAHAALKDGGRAVTAEFVPNEDRISPPTSAAFALVMLCSTPAGDAYTFSEYDAMFRAAGFSRSELHAPPASPGQFIVSDK